MRNKRLVLVATALLVAAIVAVGAAQVNGVKVPPGDIVDSPNANSAPTSLRAEVPAAPGLPASSAKVLFSEDFASGNLDRWQSFGATPATWVVKNERLQQAGDARGESADEDVFMRAKGASLGDGTLESSLFATSGSPIGLVFRGSDAGYYRLAMYGETPNDAPKLLLQKATSDGIVTVASAPTSTWRGYTLGKWHQVEVTALGSSITVKIDGTQVLTGNDSTYSSGWVGVWSYADMTAQFDNLRIQTTAGR